MNKQEFFDNCAVILEIKHDFKNIWKNPLRSGRWGPREPGNGRFPGFGVIRWFGPTYIHLISENSNKTFTSPEKALEYISAWSISSEAERGIYTAEVGISKFPSTTNFFLEAHKELETMDQQFRVEQLYKEPGFAEAMKRRMTGE